MKKILSVLAVSLACAIAGSNLAWGHTPSGICTVNFDAPGAIQLLVGSARAMFANLTGQDPATSKLVACRPGLPKPCWMYTHSCSNNWAQVDEISGYNHFHLAFTPAADYFAPGGLPLCDWWDPGDGYGLGIQRKINGVCTHINWNFTTRNLTPHDGTQVIRVRINPPGTTNAKVFGVSRIVISGTVPVMVTWHSVTDGQWHGTARLNPGTYGSGGWTQLISDIDELRFTGAPAAPGVWTLEEIGLLD